MHHEIDGFHLDLLFAAADAAAARLRWRLRLPPAEHDDLRQELLLDLIRRLPGFDPDRGGLGAFASVVLRNRSSLICARLTRGWSDHGGGLVSLDAPARSDPLVETLPYPDGEMGDAERRIDVARVLARLQRRDRALCAAVVRWPVDHLVEQGFGSRATLYRRIHEFRHVLAAHGLAA